MLNTKIKICDAIMGSGKSESAMTYIRENPDKKFVYITPYLDEAQRICNGCPESKFVEPVDTLPQFNFSKLEHTRHLLEKGKNIATTHEAFRSYTRDMIENIANNGYTLLVDEAVEVFHETNYKDGDIRMLVDAGLIVDNGNYYSCTDKEYTGDRLLDLYKMFKCNNLLRVDKNSGGSQFYYWTLPHEILTSFSEVIVLTYMFDSQEMKYYLDINQIEYEYIGISYKDGIYRFSAEKDYIPAYVSNISSMIHIFDNEKLNAIGNRWNSLSVGWMKNNPEKTKVLKNNISNFFRNYHKDSTKDDRMWSTYIKAQTKLRGKGYSTQFESFNLRASNKYRNKTVLAYCVNLFPFPTKEQFFKNNYGITYDKDKYATSIMIQWIWRSAIRDGKEIYIYVPSARMRKLLTEWINSVEKEDNC